MPLVIALLVVAVTLYVHLAVLGRSATSSVAGGVPISGGDVPSWLNGIPGTGGGARDTSAIWPPAPPDARAQPIGMPGASRSSSTDYVFMHTVTGVGGPPVAWDPCRPIHLLVNNAEAPPGADQLVREAVASVSSATGLKFVIEGITTEAPTERRAPLDRSRYGDRWSPVLVAWTDPSAVPDLQGRVAGLAGPSGAPYYTADQQHWVSGTVSLDGPQFREILQRPGGWASARAIVMHEFAHLVGLNHVPAPSQLMYEDNVGQTGFGPGDLEGLRQLGLGRCFTA
ncbi:peptidase [Terrabacter carboxydivorans]|uniref:Peptidase M10 metallopeptidase domain-containing protein n=1 Tax=Terrabacter carboxydivorans TaxID=619730 RepID=A0ABN3MC66_9MICO